ncbi:FCD domain-containing protein [Sinorhizobium glycinis]|uniref:FCD domain-containing protein n=1 Tax=Sinorhizobium glycinis TaxID=1472378 RepID=UPI0007D9AC0A|nr:FCD domain-containing protein [Sinorhizobium glycinis]
MPEITQLLNELDRIVADMQKAQHDGKGRDFLALDTAFHDALIAASGNPYFTSAYSLIGAKMAALRYPLGMMWSTASRQDRQKAACAVLTSARYTR